MDKALKLITRSISIIGTINIINVNKIIDIYMLIFNLFNSALYAGTGYSADPDCDCDPDSQCRGFFGSPPFYPLPSYDCVTRTLRIGQISHMEIKFSSISVKYLEML